MKTPAICLILILALILFGFFVYPTRYAYSQMSYMGSTYTIRIDRFTGRSEMLIPGGWMEISK